MHMYIHTHKLTRTQQNNSLLQIFKIVREGEYQRFRPFKDLHNRQLLWHGSRTTNYAGILSQGLRIAPPEAPVVSAVLRGLLPRATALLWDACAYGLQ